MWDIKTSVSCNWEPLELRLLKQELANLVCNCSTCEKSKEQVLMFRSNSDQIDAATQAGLHNGPLDRFIPAYSISSLRDKSKPYDNSNNRIENFPKNFFFLNCYFIWYLLHGIKKTLKDEEAEINPNMFMSDKFTEKDVATVDSSTSVTNKPTMQLTSNLTLCDFLSESLSNATMNSHSQTRTNRDKVTFLDDYVKINKCIVEEPKLMGGNCFCLDNFIDSIRPPLQYENC